jgi:hypothetical protein
MYFDGLQMLLLHCRGCIISLGPMLLVMIGNVTQVVNGSLHLITCTIIFSINGMEKQE